MPNFGVLNPRKVDAWIYTFTMLPDTTQTLNKIIVTSRIMGSKSHGFSIYRLEIYENIIGLTKI